MSRRLLNEKSEWPELVGKHSDVAKNAILADRPELTVITKLDGEEWPPTGLHNLVILWCHADTGFNLIVDEIPVVE